MERLEAWFNKELGRYRRDEIDAQTFTKAFKKKIHEAFRIGLSFRRWKRMVEPSDDQK